MLFYSLCFFPNKYVPLPSPKRSFLNCNCSFDSCYKLQPLLPVAQPFFPFARCHFYPMRCSKRYWTCTHAYTVPVPFPSTQKFREILNMHASLYSPLFPSKRNPDNGWGMQPWHQTRMAFKVDGTYYFIQRFMKSNGDCLQHIIKYLWNIWCIEEKFSRNSSTHCVAAIIIR